MLVEEDFDELKNNFLNDIRFAIKQDNDAFTNNRIYTKQARIKIYAVFDIYIKFEANE